MGSQTPTKGLPYPVGTDRVTDGDDAIRRLAQSVDNMVQTGTAVVNVATPGGVGSLAVVFPVAYATAPNVVVSLRSNAPNPQTACSSDAPTTTGVNVYLTRQTAGNTTVHWTAVGPVTPVS